VNEQIIFIVWRESIEALLVVGILHSWLRREANSATGMKYLQGGVAAGLVAAFALAFALMRLSEVFSGPAQDYLMTAMVFIAALLIVQMVAWMRTHGAGLKRELESSLDSAMQDNNYKGIFLLAMLAIAREGSETVIFLYGVLAATKSVSILEVAGLIFLGFVAAFLTYLLLQTGSRFMPWRRFFQISETLLLLLGCALVVTGVGNLVSLGFLPYLDPLWDSSWLLNDAGKFGGLVAALTGYRAMPDLVTVLTWAGYIVVVGMMLWRSTYRRKTVEV